MRIVIITSVIPYPLEEGGKVSQFAVLEKLVECCEVLLLCEVNNNSDLNNIEGLKSRLPRLEVRYLNRIVEPPQLTIAQRLIRKSQNILSRLGNRLSSNSVEISQVPTFYELAASSSHIFRPLEQVKIEFYKKAIIDFSPDIIQVEHNGYLTLGMALNGLSIPKIFVEHEIQYARLISNLSISNTISSELPESYLLEHIKSEESLFLKAYDHSIVFSFNDAVFLKKMLQNDNVTSIPFPIVDADFSSPGNFSTIKKLIFIGGESHYPNKEGVEALIAHLTDEQLDTLGMKLYIIGKWSDDTIKYYSNRKNMVFTGYVEDLNVFCKDSLMLAPIRIGSGIRTKILYGMAQGIPILTTDLGCEGILVENDESIVVENDLNKWAMKIDELLQNDNLKNAIVSNAYQIAVQHYSQNAVIEKRMSLYQHLIKK